MPTSTKENTLIFLALLIIYFGVYLLSQSASLAGSTSDARWAGFFSVTLGVFALLTLLFGHSNGTVASVGTSSGSVYLMTAGVALLASAFFNFKLFRSLEKNTMTRYVVLANVAAHVVLLLAYFMNFGTEARLGAYRFSNSNTPVYAPAVPSTPGLGMTSPRLPVRAR